MKTLKTNWINILGVFISILLYSIIRNLNDTTVLKTLPQAVLSSLIVVCLYGMLFWAFFIVSLIILDILLIVRDNKKLRLKLLIEWLIISLPFMYWIFRYQEWIFIVAIVSFLVTQIIREQLLNQKSSV